MNLRGLYQAPARVVKSLTRMVFGKSRNASSWLFQRVPSGFLGEMGDGSTSSTVMAPLLWVAKTFPEAPPALWTIDPESGQEKPVRDHPMLRLMQRPNLHYTGPLLWMATLLDWNLDGNAYWIIVRDQFGIPRELWWAPASLICPEGDALEFVTSYKYTPGTTDPLYLPPSDVVHFRFGMDPDNPRKGCSPLKSVMREVFTDDEAARFTASILGNMGVPGIVVSPDGGSAGADDVQATKAYFKDAFTGDRRGEPLVMRGPTKVTQFGFSPEQLLLKDLRRIPEERVTAVLGIPAIVAGLGAGLDRSTFTNMNSAKESAIESNLIPTWRSFGEDLRWQLLTQWESDPFFWRAGFELSKVRALQDDQDNLMTRMAAGVAGGMVKRSEARHAVGLDVAADGSDDVFLIPINIAEVPADPNKPHRTFTPPAGADRRGAAPPAGALLVGAASSNGNGGDPLEG